MAFMDLGCDVRWNFSFTDLNTLKIKVSVNRPLENVCNIVHLIPIY